MHPERLQLSRTWPAAQLDITAGRHLFREWLEQTSAGALADDLALVVTELLTNARNASAGLGGSIGLEARVDPGGVVVEVTNPAEPFDVARVRLDGLLPDPTSPRGRGLAIVAKLTDSLAAEVADDRISITATRRFDGR